MSLSLDQARELFIDSLAKAPGRQTTCPCCARPGALRPRAFNPNWARCLYHFYVYYGKDGVGSFEPVRQRYDYNRREESKMVYWDLITPGERRGDYAITDKGILFLREEIEIPRKVFIWKREVHVVSPEMIGVRELLAKNGYDYDDLTTMEGAMA